MRIKAIGAGAVAFFLLILTGSATAQFTNFQVNFDENGGGFIRPFPVGDPAPLHSLGNGVDPVDPGSGKMPLIYDLSGGPGFGGAVPVPGDILLGEPGAPTSQASDLLRFTPNGLLIVYSDLPEPGEPPDLADVGLPTVFQPNLLLLPETGPEGGINGLFGYIPTPNQPGFVILPPATGPVIYNYTSDVPEPAGVALACGVWIHLAVVRRRRARG